MSDAAAEVLLTHGRLLVQVLGPSSLGPFAWCEGPVHTLTEDASNDAIGAAVRDALSESRSLAPQEASGGTLRTSLVYRASKARTYREFMDGTRLVGIRTRGNEIEVQPTRSERWWTARSGYFSGLTSLPSLLVVHPSDLELGATVRQAIEACTFASPPRNRPSRVRPPADASAGE